MQDDVAQLRRRLETLERENAELRAVVDPWQQPLPASWFNSNTFVDDGTLRKAPALARERRGGRLYYKPIDVFRKWPNKFIDPMTGKMPELPRLAKRKEKELS